MALDGALARSGVRAKPGRVARRAARDPGNVAVCVLGVCLRLRCGRDERGLAGRRTRDVGRAVAQVRLGHGELALDGRDNGVRNVGADLGGRAGGIDVVEEVGRLNRVGTSTGASEVVSVTNCGTAYFQCWQQRWAGIITHGCEQFRWMLRERG